MGTGSGIVLQRERDYIGIYCNCNGYPEGVGAILKRYYTDLAKIEELINLGDISVLKKEVNPRSSSHSFSTPEPNITIAYGRDRGEKGVDAKQGSRDFVCGKLEDMDAEYLYIFEDGQWTCEALWE